MSRRKVKAITAGLCGHSFSVLSLSTTDNGPDQALPRFANRDLHEAYPYLIRDARYEKVREDRAPRRWRCWWP